MAQFKFNVNFPPLKVINKKRFKIDCFYKKRVILFCNKYPGCTLWDKGQYTHLLYYMNGWQITQSIAQQRTLLRSHFGNKTHLPPRQPDTHKSFVFIEEFGGAKQ